MELNNVQQAWCDQPSLWEAGCHFDSPTPEYR